MIINEEITAVTKDFIRYSLLLTPDEFSAARAEFEPQAQRGMARLPQALAAYTLILDRIEEAVKGMDA